MLNRYDPIDQTDYPYGYAQPTVNAERSCRRSTASPATGRRGVEVRRTQAEPVELEPCRRRAQLVVTTLPALMPRKRADVMVADFDTELVVLVPDERQAHHLDVGLSLVLDSCDGTTSTAAVVAEVALGDRDPGRRRRVVARRHARDARTTERVLTMNLPRFGAGSRPLG